MAREILFKAKRIDNGEWVEGYYCKKKQYCFDNRTDDLKTVIMTEFSSGGFVCFEVDPGTVCQLIQTDEIRVWENDIVRWEDDDECISVIRYDEENARFVFDDYGVKGCLMEYGWDEDAGGFGKVDTNGFDAFYSFGFEVIGNIFDNPELVEMGCE